MPKRTRPSSRMVALAADVEADFIDCFDQFRNWMDGKPVAVSPPVADSAAALLEYLDRAMWNARRFKKALKTGKAPYTGPPPEGEVEGE